MIFVNVVQIIQARNFQGLRLIYFEPSKEHLRSTTAKRLPVHARTKNVHYRTNFLIFMPLNS